MRSSSTQEKTYEPDSPDEHTLIAQEPGSPDDYTPLVPSPAPTEVAYFAHEKTDEALESKQPLTPDYPYDDQDQDEDALNIAFSGSKDDVSTALALSRVNLVTASFSEELNNFEPLKDKIRKKEMDQIVKDIKDFVTKTTVKYHRMDIIPEEVIRQIGTTLGITSEAQTAIKIIQKKEKMIHAQELELLALKKEQEELVKNQLDYLHKNAQKISALTTSNMTGQWEIENNSLKIMTDFHKDTAKYLLKRNRLLEETLLSNQIEIPKETLQQHCAEQIVSKELYYSSNVHDSEPSSAPPITAPPKKKQVLQHSKSFSFFEGNSRSPEAEDKSKDKDFEIRKLGSSPTHSSPK